MKKHGMTSQSHNNICSICEHQAPISPCRLCSSLTVSKKGENWSHGIDESIHSQSQELLGGSNQTSQQRWKNLQKNSFHLKDVQWARLSDETLDPVISSPCSDEELKEIIQRISDGIRLNTLQRLHLHGGFILHDGVQISIMGGRLLVNGRAMPTQVPIVSILNVLSSKKTRTGWDLTKLFVAFGSLDTARIETLGTPRFLRRQIRRGRMNNSLDKPSVSALFTWIEWMAEEHLMPAENNFSNPLSNWARDVRHQLRVPDYIKFNKLIVEAFKRQPKNLEELHAFPWLNRWNSYVPATQHNTKRPWPFTIVGDKLKFIVRTKNNASRKTAVPDEPGIWALMLSSAYSPLTSSAGELLYALQYNWTCHLSNVQQISAPLRRSIQFLHEVVDGNSDRIFIHDEHILVIGRLGHYYNVRIGRGAHSAPFIIDSIAGLNPRRTHPICIHDGTFHSTVPLGDTLVSVILTLLDDINTSAKIESLMQHLSFNSPLGFPQRITEKHLRLIDARALDTFKQVVANHPMGIANEITWLPHGSGTHRVDRNPPYQGHANMQNLFRRNIAYNRRRWQYNNADVVQTHRTEMLVEHALAADAASPHPQFIELWHQSFDEIQVEPRAEPLHHIYHHFRGREDWVQLRNMEPEPNDLPIGDIRNGERRYCEAFSRIWQALMLHPIGATFRMGVLDGTVLSFENCHLAITIRNAQERRIIRRFATLLGYAEQGRQGNAIAFVRRDQPRNNARRDLTLLLAGAQETLGVPGSPPWRWHYAEVHEAPREIPNFQWELEQDLRDQNNRNGPDDYVP